MLKALLVLPALMWCSMACAEKGKMYFDGQWHETKKENAFYLREYTREGDIYSITDYFARANRIFRTGYSTSLKSEDYACATGHYVYYNLSGQKLREGDYDKGLRTGIWKFYDLASGSITKEQPYVIDKPEGDAIIYDMAHKAVKDVQYRDGKMIKATEFGDKDTTTIVYRYNGDDRETDTYFSDGKLKGRVHDTKGSIASSEFFDKDGGMAAGNATIPPAPYVYSYVEQMPVACYSVNDYIAESLKYPEAARAHNIEGRVIIKFVINDDGSVTDAVVVRGIEKSCDEMALQVISSMPSWLPGMQNGSPVHTYFTMPVVFKLTQK